jgi:hypothetical protein
MYRSTDEMTDEVRAGMNCYMVLVPVLLVGIWNWKWKVTEGGEEGSEFLRKFRFSVWRVKGESCAAWHWHGRLGVFSAAASAASAYFTQEKSHRFFSLIIRLGMRGGWGSEDQNPFWTKH